MSSKQDEKLITVQIEDEFNPIKQGWEHRVYIKLFTALRTSGLLKALGDKNFRSLIALALFMNKDRKCHPSLEELAKALGVSVQSASARFKELCAFRWNGKPIVSRRIIRNPETKKVEKTEYTILVDSISIFDENGQNAQSSPTSRNLEVGETPDIPPTSRKLEVGQISQTLPENPENSPSSRKPESGQPESGPLEGNYIELNTEPNTEGKTVKPEGEDERSTEQPPAQPKKKSVKITLEDLQDKELDSSFLPQDFPPKFAEAVKEIRDDLETIRYYFDIARMAHKDAEKMLRTQLQEPDFAFGPVYFDDDVAAAAFRATIGQAKLGNIETDIESHFRGTVRKMLVQKELTFRQAMEQQKSKEDFVPYDWVNTDR